MWGFATAEAIADWIANHGGSPGCSSEPEPPGSGRPRSYLCQACGVHGRGLDDGSLTCWCCDNADVITFDKVSIMPSCHNAGTTASAGFGQVEEVDSLVG